MAGLDAVSGDKGWGKRRQKVCWVMLRGTSMGNHQMDGDVVRALVVSDAVRSAKQPGHNGRHPHGLEEIHILR